MSRECRMRLLEAPSWAFASDSISRLGLTPHQNPYVRKGYPTQYFLNCSSHTITTHLCQVREIWNREMNHKSCSSRTGGFLQFIPRLTSISNSIGHYLVGKAEQFTLVKWLIGTVFGTRFFRGEFHLPVKFLRHCARHEASWRLFQHSSATSCAFVSD